MITKLDRALKRTESHLEQARRKEETPTPAQE